MVTVSGDGTAMTIVGNGWKKIAFPYAVTANTILEFDFKSSTQGEIHAIGIDDDNKPSNSTERFFQLYGTDNAGGNEDFRNYADSAGEFKHYKIPVGQYYTGEMGYLTFINDDDRPNPIGEGQFANLKIYEETPQNPQTFKIMPLGDSITRGVDGVTPVSDQGGYRTDLWNRLQTSGFNLDFDFVGSLSNGPDSLDPNHEGHGGWRIDQISNGRASDPDAGSINDWLNAFRPDMILLKAGTNDMGFSGDSPAKAADELSGLIDQITGLLPKAKVLVASIIPVDPSRNSSIRQDFDDRVIAFNELIPDIVDNKVGAGKNVTFVDIFSALTLGDLAPDGFHPNAPGYSKMADVWFNAIDAIV